MDIRRAVIRAYNAALHQADLQLAGGGPTNITAIPVSKQIPGSIVAPGTGAAVLFFDQLSREDAIVFAIFP